MRCKKCGAELEIDTKFCSNCGTAIEDVSQKDNISSESQETNQGTFYTPVQQSQSSNTGQYVSPTNVTPFKKKKLINKRAWFIILVIFIVFCILVSLFGGHKAEKIVWNDMVLGSMLPEPPANKGEIFENSEDELWLGIEKVSEKQYSDYVDSCEAKGFNVDAEKESSSYKAYNEDGYKLELSCYDEEMNIALNKPIEMTTIKWPTSKLGKLLPEPKSKKGNFSYEYDTGFGVYIADTSIEDYNQYVNEVSKAGFNLDYDKSEKYYNAKNIEAYSVTVKYEGYNIMSINIDSPAEDDSSGENTAIAEKTTEATTIKESTTKNTTTTIATEAKPSVLTVKNCPELKKLLELKDPTDPLVQEFADKHYGDTIKFDGCVMLRDNYIDFRGKVYNTRYNIMLGAGDFNENSQRGPNFIIENVGNYEIEGIYVGQNVLVEATVGDYDEDTTIFTIHLVSINER